MCRLIQRRFAEREESLSLTRRPYRATIIGSGRRSISLQPMLRHASEPTADRPRIYLRRHDIPPAPQQVKRPIMLKHWFTCMTISDVYAMPDCRLASVPAPPSVSRRALASRCLPLLLLCYQPDAYALLFCRRRDAC